MKSRKIQRTSWIWLSCILLLGLTSCTSNSQSTTKKTNFNLPTVTGFFVILDKTPFEIEPHEIDEIDFHNTVLLSNLRPEFVIYDYNFEDLSRLKLYDHQGNEIPFLGEELKNTDTSHPMFYVTVGENLQDKFYCFMEEYFLNPYIEASQYKYAYCFGQGSPERLGISIFRKDYEIANIEGFFLEGPDEINELIPITLQDEIDVNSLPVTNHLMPTFFLRSTSIDPDTVKLIWYPASIGIRLYDNTTITHVIEEKGAMLAGIQEDDEIIAVNGVDVTKWNDEYSSSLDSYYLENSIANSCKIGSSINVTVLRGTQQYLAPVDCDLQEVFTIGYHPYSIFGGMDPNTVSYAFEGEELIYSIDPNGYAIFTTTFPLSPDNVYCIHYSGKSPRYCFMVK